MYYKIGPLLHLISAKNEWMSWEKGREKWLYQQWYGVNLLIGVMCVTVPHALICSLYATLRQQKLVSSPPLESGARIEYGLKNWNWNDSHGFASGASVILDIKILVKKLWRGKDLLLTRWACTEMINLILKSRTKEWRKSDVRAIVKRNNNINWNVCKNIKLGGTLPSHTDIFAANQRHIISWRNHCQPLYLIFCDYLIISAYLK